MAILLWSVGESGKALGMELRKAVFNSTKTSSGNVTVYPSEIYDSFREFYENVYKSEHASEQEP